ncbi:MAG: 1-acyl-sn-glycerol-3-phosphate acyltransferase [Thermoleophilia bacterium]|nr:1-acyl-sn-glycerol-3-phosphate acyltransferase [Thermoleophilia bacterium]
MSLLYDAVAAGMTGYTRAAFALETLGPRRLDFRPATLVVVTHRRETDVPLVSPILYARARLWRRRSRLERMTFAARDDMFLPAFFAGFPPALPPGVRRLLFPLGVGRWLPRVQVAPLRSAHVARLGEVLRLRRGERLDALLSAGELERFLARAEACGLAAPVRVADVFRGEYADLLWRSVRPDDPAAASLERFWSRRAAQAAADLRGLVDLLRAGGTLVVFPEGRPSPDGEIGPVQRGVASLVRRGRPRVLLPAALAYDPLARGRTRVAVGIGDVVPAPAENVEEAVLSLLRRTMPLTAGQIVAAGADVESALVEAQAARRPVETALLDPARRARRIAEAAATAPRRPADVAFLQREYASARA